MAEEGEKQGKGFKVEDRRRFSETGEARESAKTDERPSDEPVRPAAAAGGGARAEERSAEALPEINFSTFIISLSTQALMHLGEIADPVSGKAEADLPGAKQMIDILSLLQEKTRGNLDAGEQQLMEDVLYDLRMRYVDAVKKK
ncbi:MAG TPA: DUF1844 domain-containing protein [Verrucomicrobiae bacterium]|jgi:Domain of unknown function (DUF1844)|nr:DUF1844 domain-containing protein [Verrucomicrobiae bacterium]